MKEKYYIISPDRNRWDNYAIDASRELAIPGLHCTMCGEIWAWSGLEFPSIDLQNYPEKHLLKKHEPISVNEFMRLKRNLANYINNSNVILAPGASFGTVLGRLDGEFADFSWLMDWNLFVREERYLELLRNGITILKTIKPNLNFISDLDIKLLELSIEEFCNLSLNSPIIKDKKKCDMCGRISIRVRKNEIIINKSSIPQNQELFRIIEAPTQIVCTNNFKANVERIGLTNILFKEIEIY